MATQLDPFVFRAPYQGATGRIESVSSTHLYAYLQDGDLPSQLHDARSMPLDESIHTKDFRAIYEVSYR